MEVHTPNPFLTSPFCCLEIPPPISWKPFLTYLEIPPLCRGTNSHPLWSQVGCILTPPHSPIPLSPSQRFPLLKCMPSHNDIAISASHSPIQLLFSKRISMVWRAVEMGSKITEENSIGGVSPFCSSQLRPTVLL
jgi:hypothetical protein